LRARHAMQSRLAVVRVAQPARRPRIGSRLRFPRHVRFSFGVEKCSGKKKGANPRPSLVGSARGGPALRSTAADALVLVVVAPRRTHASRLVGAARHVGGSRLALGSPFALASHAVARGAAAGRAAGIALLALDLRAHVAASARAARLALLALLARASLLRVLPARLPLLALLVARLAALRLLAARVFAADAALRLLPGIRGSSGIAVRHGLGSDGGKRPRTRPLPEPQHSCRCEVGGDAERKRRELVEWKGIEPSTFALRTRRSPS